MEFDKKLFSFNLNGVPEFFLCTFIFIFSAYITKLGQFPLKAVILLGFFFSAFILFLKESKFKIASKSSIYILVLSTCISCVIGIANGFYSQTVSQSMSLIASFSVVLISFSLYWMKKINIEKIEKIIFITALTGILVKIICGLGIMYGLFSSEGLNYVMNNYVGAKFFEAVPHFGLFPAFPRIGSAGDLFYYIVFLFYARKFSGLKIPLIWTLLLFFTIISNSRYLLLIFSIISVYLLGCFARNFFCKKISILTSFFLILFFLILIFLFSNYLNMLIPNIIHRYTGNFQSESDAIRNDTFIYLYKSFYENFWFGIGMGGYIPNFIRNSINLWQYELEYLAMLMQFGIFGFLFIFMNYFFLVLVSIFSNYQRDLFLPILISIFGFLLTPVHSCLFISTNSSLIILSIFFLSQRRV